MAVCFAPARLGHVPSQQQHRCHPVRSQQREPSADVKVSSLPAWRQASCRLVDELLCETVSRCKGPSGRHHVIIVGSVVQSFIASKIIVAERRCHVIECETQGSCLAKVRMVSRSSIWLFGCGFRITFNISTDTITCSRLRSPRVYRRKSVRPSTPVYLARPPTREDRAETRHTAAVIHLVSLFSASA